MNNFVTLILHDQQFLFDTILLVIAFLRIAVEFMPYTLSKLPISQYLKRHLMPNAIEKFHRFGLVMASGYVVFGLPYLIMQVALG